MQTYMKQRQLQELLTDWYVGEKEVDNGRVARAYDEIARVNSKKCREIPVNIVVQDRDPYDSYHDMRTSVEEEGKLRVFSGGNPPRYLTNRQNVKARAAHDWHGHLSRGCDFSQRGEWLKYQHVKNDYPSETHGILFTEIVVQRAVVSVLPDGFEDDRYEQKAVSAPTRLRELTAQVMETRHDGEATKLDMEKIQ